MGNYYDPHGGRPPRINQWNIALQREFIRNVALEAAYVGNRGVWEEANNMGAMNYISEARLKAFGLSLNNAADRDLLTRNLSDPLVIARGFTRALRRLSDQPHAGAEPAPVPAIHQLLTPTWAPLGSSWYDSLQMKADQALLARLRHDRLVHLAEDAGAGQRREQRRGANGGGINDMFNRANQKSLAGDWRPLTLVVAFNYRTPRADGEQGACATSRATGPSAGILTYRSGALIERADIGQLST